MSKKADAGQTLAQHLVELIRRNGPITFHDWMESALYNEHRGYYQRADLQRWGRVGDYRTAPETSSLLAATIARYFASLFQHNELTILEVGAGAGDFAAEFLDTLQREYRAVFQRTTYLIDEISQHTRKQIAERLARTPHQVAFKKLSEVDPINPGIVFANEVLDAFPVHRVVLRNGELKELYVKVNDDESFAWLEGPLSTDKLRLHLKQFDIRLREGQTVEINSHLHLWFSQASERLQRGYIVIVDYGAEAEELYANDLRMNGTLRAFKRHKLVTDVLKSPGEQDITSTVDWTSVMKIASGFGFELVRFERLDQFLLQEGLLEELEHRVTQLNDESARMRLRTTAREMILPSGMARSFQVLVWKRGEINAI